MSRWLITDTQRWSASFEGELLKANVYSEPSESSTLVESLNEHWKQQKENARRQLDQWKHEAKVEAQLQFKKEWFTQVNDTLIDLTELTRQNQHSLLHLCEQVSLKAIAQLPEPQLVTALLKQSFEELTGSPAFTVRLHPDHLKQLTQLESDLNSWLPNASITWREDKSLNKHAILLDSPFGQLKFDVFQDIKESFKQLLGSSS